MDERKYSLLYMLNRFINDSDDSVNEVLAKYFICNFNNANRFNIYDIAEECGVSRSSIRRFCQKMSFDNFIDMKKYMASLDNDSRNISDDNFRNMLTASLLNMITELDQRMHTDQIDYVCKLFKNAERIYISCSGNSIQATKNFQLFVF